jgi:hypothetical protein
MSMAELEFGVSDVRVRVASTVPGALEALSLIWEHAAPVLPVARTVAGRLEASEGVATVRLGAAERRCRANGVVAAFERLLYEALADWHPPPRVLLHAAAVWRAGTVFVLAGPSGCGKSSLALALLEQGAGYLSDELVVFDGARVWGLPRAPQFEPIVPGSPVPARLAATDRETYRFEDVEGQPRVLPVRRLRAAEVAAGPYPADRVQLVFPEPGSRQDAGLYPVDPRTALQRLLAETRSDARSDLGPLLSRGALVLPWSDISHAADSLIRT